MTLEEAIKKGASKIICEYLPKTINLNNVEIEKVDNTKEYLNHYLYSNSGFIKSSFL